MTDAPVTLGRVTPLRRPVGWAESTWLQRLASGIGIDRARSSPTAAALPAMLVALGWTGTARTLAGLLPPEDVPLTLDYLERQLLPAIGFRGHRTAATGTVTDTEYLRAGSLVQAAAGAVHVYLGRPDGTDRWLIDGHPGRLELTGHDLLLAVEPDPDFRPVDEARPHWFRGLFEQVRDALFNLFAMSFVINVLALAISFYTMAVYSVVIPSGTTATIWGMAVLALVATLGAWALRIGRQTVSAKMGSWAGVRIGTASMRKMLSLPLEMTAKFGIHNNVVRMRSFESARQFLSGAGGTYLIDYPFVAIFVVVIALMGGWLVLVPVTALLVYAAIAFPTSDYVASKSALAGVASSRLEEHASTALLGLNAFYQAGADSQWQYRFADLARDSAARNRDYAIAVARAQAIGQALTMLTVLATMCTGIVLVLSSAMDAGGLVASMMLIWRITTPAQQAFGSLVRLRQVRSSVQALDRLMATPAERAGAEITSPTGLTDVQLAADRLYYRPDADQDAALNGVSFSVAPGSRVAIVGPNAGGKTILMECLAGLRRPQSGRVLVDGRDSRQFDAAEYRAWIGYVPQLVPGLPLTVRDYLRLRVPAMRDADALTAFESIAGADWKQLPLFGGDADNVLERWLNPLSDDHADLQLRHLVAFVAATLRSPAILLLDGDGIGGDPEWEQRILRYLDSIRGRTTVVWAIYSVAHIQTCDQVVILERGNVLQAGPPVPATAKPDGRA